DTYIVIFIGRRGVVVGCRRRIACIDGDVDRIGGRHGSVVVGGDGGEGVAARAGAEGGFVRRTHIYAERVGSFKELDLRDGAVGVAGRGSDHYIVTLGERGSI